MWCLGAAVCLCVSAGPVPAAARPVPGIWELSHILGGHGKVMVGVSGLHVCRLGNTV